MRRVIICAAALLVFTIMQTTIFANALAIGGISPNLVLMFTCIAGFMRGKKTGMFTGFFGGILVDIMTSGAIGMTSLIYVYAGYMNGVFFKEYDKELIVFPMILVGICDFAYGILVFMTKFLVRARLDLWFYLKRIIIPEVIYTVALTIVAYELTYYLVRKLDSIDKKRSKRNVSRDVI